MSPERALGRRLFGRWAAWIARRRLARLDDLDLHGLDHLRRAVAEGPVVAAANHVCWWDALVVVHVSHLLGVDLHVVVDEESLGRFRFFGALGAVAVDLRSPMAARRGLAEARSRLQGPGDLLWIFPQGRYRPSHQRPLGVRRGAGHLARRAGAALMPMGLCYPFLQGPQPACFATLGEPCAPEQLEGALVDAIEAGEARAEARRHALVPQVDGATRLLGWFVGGSRG